MGAPITALDILSSDGHHSDRAKAVPKAIADAAMVFAVRLNELFIIYPNERPTITSGYRTPAANKAAGGKLASAHLEGRAADFYDPNHVLYDWCFTHKYDLERIGLWCEQKAYTRTWCHLTSRPVADRFFVP